MGQVSNIFQYINDEGEVVEYPRFANPKTVGNLVDVLNIGRSGQLTAEAVVQTLRYAKWEDYKKSLEKYESEKARIEEHNETAEEPLELPEETTWSDDDIAHITVDYVWNLPEVKAAIKTKQKEKRSLEVDNIVVEVDGMSFDGDEVSQNRMARAITALSVAEQPSTTWKLSNNELATVTKEQLAQALALAGQAQTNIWANYG